MAKFHVSGVCQRGGKRCGSGGTTTQSVFGVGNVTLQPNELPFFLFAGKSRSIQMIFCLCGPSSCSGRLLVSESKYPPCRGQDKLVLSERSRFPGIPVITTGNELVPHHMEARLADAGVFYPITLSTEMGEIFQSPYAEDLLNVFGRPKMAIRAEGEHAASWRVRLPIMPRNDLFRPLRSAVFARNLGGLDTGSRHLSDRPLNSWLCRQFPGPRSYTRPNAP
jgi:hypothetical protein